MSAITALYMAYLLGSINQWYSLEMIVASAVSTGRVDLKDGLPTLISDISSFLLSALADALMVNAFHCLISTCSWVTNYMSLKDMEVLYCVGEICTRSLPAFVANNN